MAKAQKAKSKGRKIGRDIKKCAKYRSMAKREKARVKRLKKHLKRQPQDKVARVALQQWEGLLQMGGVRK